MRIKPKLIISTFRKLNSICSTSKELGIHRSTVYRWLKKAKSPVSNLRLSSFSLKRKSTKPKTIHYALSPKDKFEILSLREKRGSTAIKIKYELNLKASTSTVHRFLLRKGLIETYGNHRRPKYQKTTHMHLKNVTQIGFLQMDVKIYYS